MTTGSLAASGFGPTLPPGKYRPAMRITLELETDDVARFHDALRRADKIARVTDECDILDAAKQALDTLPIGSAPGFVRKRLVEVQRLIVMLEDEAWALRGAERHDVLRALVYFSDPEDLIPDEIEVIGLIDDAIMLELLLRRLKHVLEAYTDFCGWRAENAGAADDRLGAAAQLAHKRTQLQERMRRRARRMGRTFAET